MSERAHELRIYAGRRHKSAPADSLILHLWFTSEHSMQMDLDVAMHRPDVSHVDLIDCTKHTTARIYSKVA